MKKQIGLFTAILFAVSIAMMACKAEVHTHTFAEEWTNDEINHWRAATCEHKDEVIIDRAKHTFGNWTTTKEPTEEAKGSRERSCTVCGYTATEVIAKLEHTHKFATEWTSDETNHWHASTCGHEVTKGKTAHTFDDWITTKEATCTEEGNKTRTCEVCKKEVTEKIDAKGHSYSESRTSDASGHWYACVCGAKKDFEEHYGTWKVLQVPTASTEGTSKRECKICSFEETKQIIPIPEGFVFVQGGTITGSAYTNNYKGVFIEGRTVTLSDFYMGKYEVTQEEYASVMAGQKVTVNGTEYALESNPSYCTADSTSYTLFNSDVQEKRPVEGGTWYDSVWYCNALSQKEGLTPAYNIEVTEVKQESGKTGYYIYSANVTLNTKANGYRLPTEAEWEYAARGGDPTAADWNYVFSGADTAEGVSYSSSENSGLDSVGWYCYNNITGITGDSDVTNNVSGKGTHQVGKKAPNRLGLYDMSGNVWEWCYDYDGKITTTTPAGGATSGNYRVIRGGSWDYYANDASVAIRYCSIPSSLSNGHGFRVVRPSSN